MIRQLFFIWILFGLSLAASGQKSRVLSIFQMIESGKYKEAKEAIDLAVWNDKTSNWHRTYYAKGLLCQTAYEAGFEKNDTKKTNLYPDQLFVAYNAYEKALKLDSRKKIHSNVTKQYYTLSNDFQKLGERLYLQKNYTGALKALEHALLVSKSPLLSVQTDTNLVSNIAMAAYESKDWEKAISYLTGLDQDGFSPNTALLLYRAHVENGDSLLAEEVLFEGVERYDSDENIVLQLVDLMVTTGRMERAISILDSAVVRMPENFLFPWTRGLVYQRMDMNEVAIENFFKASELAPDEVRIYYNLGICYYNIGVEISESARHIRNNVEYQAARSQAKARFQDAVKWLEKAYEMDPGDQQTISKLYQLYYRLQMTKKQKTMELLIR
ncbi:MAG: hypothetical protein KAR19_14970 [Bacteroidales bacterium]|nr:hypothetical protein [Bacteroidales bacterium]